MRTTEELRELFLRVPFGYADAHIHTHLCDGQPDMTVANIAEKALVRGMKLIVLTPHFHKRVFDETAELYADTDESILLHLRDEISEWNRCTHDKLTILLSTEADLLNVEGDSSLRISAVAADALDFVTPTVNYHPLLPLKAVEVTYGRCIGTIHGSGLYRRYAEQAGGIAHILETLYQTEANGILRSPYPAMLGHFFAAHSYAVDSYNWFGVSAEHTDLMRRGAETVLDACVKKQAAIDLTGIHCGKLTYAEKRECDGFFFDFQQWFIRQCREREIPILSGSDAHGLGGVGDVAYYRQYEKGLA